MKLVKLLLALITTQGILMQMAPFQNIQRPRCTFETHFNGVHALCETIDQVGDLVERYLQVNFLRNISVRGENLLAKWRNLFPHIVLSYCRKKI